MAFGDYLSEGSVGTHRREGAARLARRRGQSREIQKTKNSGNEAKKWLKIKGNHFFNAAIYACFARILAQNEH